MVEKGPPLRCSQPSHRATFSRCRWITAPGANWRRGHLADVPHGHTGSRNAPSPKTGTHARSRHQSRGARRTSAGPHVLTPPRPDTHTWTLVVCEAPLPSFAPGTAGRGSQRAPRPTACCRLPRPHGGPHTPPGDPCPPPPVPTDLHGRFVPHGRARPQLAPLPLPLPLPPAARRPPGLCRRARPAISTGAVPAPPSAPPLPSRSPGTPPGNVVPAAPLPSARRRHAGGEGLQLPPCSALRRRAGREPRSGCRGRLGRAGTAPVPCGRGRTCGRRRPAAACSGPRRCGPCPGQGGCPCV